jgi:hypothetical protein
MARIWLQRIVNQNITTMVDDKTWIVDTLTEAHGVITAVFEMDYKELGFTQTIFPINEEHFYTSVPYHSELLAVDERENGFEDRWYVRRIDTYVLAWRARNGEETFVYSCNTVEEILQFVDVWIKAGDWFTEDPDFRDFCDAKWLRDHSDLLVGRREKRPRDLFVAEVSAECEHLWDMS